MSGAEAESDDPSGEILRVRRENARFKAEREWLPVPLVDLDAENRISGWNRAAEKLLGWTREEVIGRYPIPWFVPADSEAYMLEVVEQLRQGVTDKHCAVTSPTKTGGVVVCDWYHTPRFDEDGTYVGRTAVGCDVTARIEAENELRKTMVRLRESWHYGVHVQEEERKRLSWELHSQVGGDLSALARLIDNLRNSPNLETINDCLITVHQVLDWVRDITLDLRPAHLDDAGLAKTIKVYASRFGTRTGLAVEIDVPEDEGPTDLGGALRLTAYRVIQEALTNVDKHAEAKSVRVSMVRSSDDDDDDGGDWLCVSVSDDGKGFDLNEVHQLTTGLSAIKERSERAGGIWTIRSGTAGTTVTVTFPVGDGGGG